MSNELLIVTLCFLVIFTAIFIRACLMIIKSMREIDRINKHLKDNEIQIVCRRKYSDHYFYDGELDDIDKGKMQENGDA